ncbi:hypothetical protein [Ruegeria atlantica]|uniref:hypothetical protein n=1 Tax=Ruegeria atlantica TaxID=81569 RepID=UPI001479E5A0|nr:hypothetical protein [Ruegeria atlantica]
MTVDRIEACRSVQEAWTQAKLDELLIKAEAESLRDDYMELYDLLNEAQEVLQEGGEELIDLFNDLIEDPINEVLLTPIYWARFIDAIGTSGVAPLFIMAPKLEQRYRRWQKKEEQIPDAEEATADALNAWNHCFRGAHLAKSRRENSLPAPQ